MAAIWQTAQQQHLHTHAFMHTSGLQRNNLDLGNRRGQALTCAAS